MVNEQLKEYIKQSRQAGISDDAIKVKLRDAGWQEADIAEGLLVSTGIYSNVVPDFPQNKEAQLVAADKPRGLIRSKKKIVISAAISLVLLLFLSVGLIWYFLYYPQLVKNKVIAGIQKTQVSKIKGEISVTGSDKQTYKATLDGYFNSKDEKHQKADFKLGADLPMGEGVNIQAETNIKIIDDKIYIKMSKTPNPVGMFDLSSIKDQWIYIDMASLQNVAGGEGIKTNSVSTKETDKIFATTNIYKEFKKVKGEKVDGVACHRFDFEINKDKLADLVVEMVKAENKDMKEEDVKSLKVSLTDALKDVESIKGSIYSGKKDYLLRKMEFHIKGKDLSVDVSAKYSDIGKEQEVKAPEKYKTFQEIFSNLFNSTNAIDAGSTKQKADNARIKANAARLQAALEDCYDPKTKTYPSIKGTCMTSKFDGGVVPLDSIDYVMIGSSYTLTLKLEGEPAIELKNKQ